MIRWILFVVICGLIDFYAFQAFRTLSKSSWLTWLYWVTSIIVISNFIYQINDLQNNQGFTTPISYSLGFFLAFLVFKLVLVFFMFGEDIIRLPQAIYRYFTLDNSSEVGYMVSRRNFISKIALGVAAIPFISLLYGMYKGKYNFKVLKYTLSFDDLPDAFDGYRITQISDIHSGSFDNKEKVAYAVDLINEQASDIILFTGDIVNNKATELLPWKSIFSKLNAKDGMFSVLGNHDYGDYVSWSSEVEKAENLKDLMRIQKEMGFDLLLNESRFIEKNGQRIAILGVENWGKGFKQKGDLSKASETVDANDFKVLMSHDPTHWEEQVIDDDYHYHLTLSGHTHGMQFGIEIPGLIKWSPVKWRYKYWAGMYKQAGQYINVNRGFGVLAYPGRVGI